MHGIPGATMDVVVDGDVVVPGFEPGTMQDISSFAGQTLQKRRGPGRRHDGRRHRTDRRARRPGSGNWTVIAHLDADGTRR